MDEAKLKAEERGRADAINASMAAMSRRQTAPTILGISEPLPTPTRKGFYYAGFFVLAVAAHVLAYLIYTSFSQKNTEVAISSITEPAPLSQPEQYSVAPQPNPPTQVNDTVSPAKIEYNVYHVVPKPPQPVYQPTQADTITQEQPAPPNLKAHQSAAYEYARDYFNKRRVGSGNIWSYTTEITTESPVKIPGWEQYRTNGTAKIEFYNGQNLKTITHKFEVVTELKEGTIIAVELSEK